MKGIHILSSVVIVAASFLDWKTILQLVGAGGGGGGGERRERGRGSTEETNRTAERQGLNFVQMMFCSDTASLK